MWAAAGQLLPGGAPADKLQWRCARSRLGRAPRTLPRRHCTARLRLETPGGLACTCVACSCLQGEEGSGRRRPRGGVLRASRAAQGAPPAPPASVTAHQAGCCLAQYQQGPAPAPTLFVDGVPVHPHELARPSPQQHAVATGGGAVLPHRLHRQPIPCNARARATSGCCSRHGMHRTDDAHPNPARCNVALSGASAWDAMVRTLVTRTARCVRHQ